MLKEKLFYFLITLFLGILYVYIESKPKHVIIKNPKLNSISNIKFMDDTEEDSEETCNLDN